MSREVGTPTADSASALEPPALTDSEIDSESDDESHNDALIFKERRWFTNSFGMVVENKAKTGSTVFNELKTDAFRPLGRASSRSRAKATTGKKQQPNLTMILR